MKKILFVMLAIAFLHQSIAQNHKFGKVSVEELQEKFYQSDSTANAAYLFKEKKIQYEFDGQSGWKLITEVHEKIKIYTDEGFDHATQKINLYVSGDGEEKISSFNAQTYNIVNGKPEKVKLSKSQIFKEKSSKNIETFKFTMPSIKKGTVVEWKYKISSPYYHYIDEITLQNRIPIKKLSVVVQIPEYFVFTKHQKGYLPINIKETTKNKSIDYFYRAKVDPRKSNSILTSRAEGRLEFKDHIYKIEKENIPALSLEPYINNMNNYRSGILLELSNTDFPWANIKYYTTTWKDVAKTILLSPNFGEELNKTAHLNADINSLKENITSSMSDKIFGSLQYVKSKIKWNGRDGKYVGEGLRKAYKEGSGNVADINLTLVSVLRKLGVNANPVLVSTRKNGVPVFPTIKGFNYVIVAVETAQGIILLDASEKYSLPNVLPSRVLNWKGTIIRKDGTLSFVDLESSNISLTDTNLSYKISSEGLISGMNRTKYINLAAINYRNEKAAIEKNDLISHIEDEKGDIEVINFRLSNKNNIDKPMAEMFTFEKEDGVEMIGNNMYIQPMLFNATKENPFKLDVREYPVSFGTSWQHKTNVVIQIPDGFNVETLPENIAYGISDELGKFIYTLKNSGNKIQIQSLVEINKGVISANYYAELKEFFKQIVSKQTEKIVLVKSSL